MFIHFRPELRKTNIFKTFSDLHLVKVPISSCNIPLILHLRLNKAPKEVKPLVSTALFFSPNHEYHVPQILLLIEPFNAPCN